MNSNWEETHVQVFYLHRIPKMQLVSFNELSDFDRKHGSTENKEEEN